MSARLAGLPALALILCGASSASASPFLFTTIDVPGSFRTTSQDINNSGAIVGTFGTLPMIPRVRRGYLLEGGTFTTLEVPGSARTSAANINSSGEIVGFFTDSADIISHGFR